jgi:hypothetical protein
MTVLSHRHRSAAQRLHDPSPAVALSVRRAGLADLDAMVNIGLNAMPMDPQWNWRFEHRHHFPDDYERCTSDIYRGFLENRLGNWCVLLAEKPVGGIHGVLQPVAFAVWNVGNLLALFTATLAMRDKYQLSNRSGERPAAVLGQRLSNGPSHDGRWKHTPETSTQALAARC